MSQHNTKSIDAQCHEWAERGLRMARNSIVHRYRVGANASWMQAQAAQYADRIIAARTAELAQQARDLTP